jgi:hypothetical protein
MAVKKRNASPRFENVRGAEPLNGDLQTTASARIVGKQEVIQLSENADSDLDPAGSSRILAFLER